MEIFLISIAIVILLFILINNLRHKKKESLNAQVSISELILSVKDQLQKLEKDRIDSNKASLFKVESFDLELNFIIKKSSSIEGGIKNEVITLNNSSNISNEIIQKIHLHMKIDSEHIDTISATTNFK